MKATSGCMIEELVCLCKKVSHSGPEHIPDHHHPDHGAVEVTCCPSKSFCLFRGSNTLAAAGGPGAG